MTAKHKIFLYKIYIYSYELVSSAFDFVIFWLRIPLTKRTSTTPAILFVGEQLPPRVARIAKWIRRESNYRTILLCHQRGYVKAFSANESFDKEYLFRNKWHMASIALHLKGIVIIHGFAPKSKFPNIARKSLSNKYVHDMQDVYTIYYNGSVKLRWLNKELPYEAECLKRANGIIAHSLEPQAALRILKPEKKPRTIFFPLYCDDDFFKNTTKTFSSDDIHLVYAGGVAGRHRNTSQYGNIQFHSLIEMLTDQHLHFHIYPSPSNMRADYEEYYQIAKTNPYFHFHEPVDQDRLASELSQYHFGLLPFFQSKSEQSPLKLKYATTLKLFNYLEAGLPVIVSQDIIYQNWILNRYHMAVNINEKNVSQLREKIELADYENLLRNVHKGRIKLSLKTNIRRIISFYECIMNVDS